MSCGIYKIENKVNGKVYIGQSVDIEKRWKTESNIRPNKHFDNAWVKYGPENFEFSILKECDKEDLNQLEFFFQCAYASFCPKYGYNVAIGWTNGWKAVNEKIRKGEINHPMKNHIWTEEQKLNMSNGRKGKYKGDDHYLSKMSDADKKSFVKEKCGTFTAEWWNNGIEQKRCFECPGEGWVRGMCKPNPSWQSCKGKKSWTNGIINKMAFECPGPDFHLGRTKLK